MRRALTAFVPIALLLIGCSSSRPTVTPFCGLEPGLTQSEFLTGTPTACALRVFSSLQSSAGYWSAPDRAPGPLPDSVPPSDYSIPHEMSVQYSSYSSPSPGPYKTVTIDHDVWEIWVYDVYRRWPMRDHREYAVFKNGGLVAWGLGMPSKALLAHPEETFEFVAGTSTSARTRSEALVTHEAKLH